ncbi:MAG: hypothetical protein WCT12_30330, partial [Verrucomicrobiota bacterium]
QNWSKPAISWELNPKTGVGTTDFTDSTDKEGIAVPRKLLNMGLFAKALSQLWENCQVGGSISPIGDWF